MQFFKRSIDPLYTILGFGFLLCIIMSLVTMSQVGTLQEQIDQLTSVVDTMVVEPVEETDDTTPHDLPDGMSVQTDRVTVTTNMVSIQAENGIVVETISTAPTLYYDQGLFVPSGLSAEQFNQVIDQALYHYNRSPEVYLAYNLGATFEEIERTYGINALYLIAITQRESGFNSSDNAKVTNNLTSIMSGSSLKSYGTVEENLRDTARLLRNVYCNKWGLTNIYEVGVKYNPVNDSWASKVQESVNLFYSLINTPIT